jgi:hypothetical protein
MGQLITVVEKPSNRPGIVRFEINRPLSGMGHERYDGTKPIEGDRPVDELARRLMATGQAAGIHINGNIITVDLADGSDAQGLAEIIRDLFQYYRPGVTPSIL